MEPINHDPEESGFHIPFAKRPRRDTDGHSRATQQAHHEQNQQSHLAEPRKSGALPQYKPRPNQYEPPHSLLDQLAIAAVPGEQPRYRNRDEPMPQAPMGMAYSQFPHPQASEQEVWRSPGGTHRVVQFDHSPHLSDAHPTQPPHPSAMDTSALAPPSPNMQTRSPSQGRKRSLQDEDKEEEDMKMQGGFRRSMRRALSMSMEDSQRPAALLKALEDAAARETAEMKDEKRRIANKSATPEGGRPNVRYVKPQTSKLNLRDKKIGKAEKVEKKAASPVRGRKPSAKARASKESDAEEVTPEKRGRGRPPKVVPTSSAKGKKSAKAIKAPEEPEHGENEEDEQAAIEEQLAQEEKRNRGAMKETKKSNVKEMKAKMKDEKKEEEETPGRTFRSVRLQAKYIDKK